MLRGLLGSSLVIPDETIGWLKHLMTTAESERWIQLYFKHVEFQRQVPTIQTLASSAVRTRHSY
jgi:hypothetical protein